MSRPSLGRFAAVPATRVGGAVAVLAPARALVAPVQVATRLVATSSPLTASRPVVASLAQASRFVAPSTLPALGRTATGASATSGAVAPVIGSEARQVGRPQARTAKPSGALVGGVDAPTKGTQRIVGGRLGQRPRPCRFGARATSRLVLAVHARPVRLT